MTQDDPGRAATGGPAQLSRSAESPDNARDEGTRTWATPWIAQAGKGRIAVMTGLPLFAGRPYLCGPAVTCACAPEDNLAVHAALVASSPGSVIVCDGGGTASTGLVGEFMATDAAGRGLAGMVIDGPVRDLDDLDRLGFPVLCRGTAPAQSTKTRVVSLGQPVVVGGVLVATGDQIVADRDSAVVVPAADWAAVSADAAALADREDRTRARLAAGERLADIIGLDLSAYRPH
jgi:4-hydroxy-4-methyl-2-oxoglutarate aldolase